MESPSQVLLGSQSEEFGWFSSMSTSSTPIWVDTREVGHIHVLLPTLGYSVPVSSPVAPSLTSPRALCSQVLQASSASKGIRRVLQKFMDFYLGDERSGCFWSRLSILGVYRVLRVVFRVFLRLHRGYEVLKPRIYLDIWCAMYSRSIWSSPQALV